MSIKISHWSCWHFLRRPARRDMSCLFQEFISMKYDGWTQLACFQKKRFLFITRLELFLKCSYVGLKSRFVDLIKLFLLTKACSSMTTVPVCQALPGHGAAANDSDSREIISHYWWLTQHVYVMYRTAKPTIIVECYIQRTNSSRGLLRMWLQITKRYNKLAV